MSFLFPKSGIVAGLLLAGALACLLPRPTAAAEGSPPLPLAAAHADLDLAPWPGGDLHPDAGLATLQSYALARNAGVAAAVDRWRAAAAARDAAGALPDPRLGLGLMIEPVETRLGPQRRVWSLAQTVPWFGTLGLRRAAAVGRTAAAAAEVRAEALAVSARVVRAWSELAWVGRALAVVEEHRDVQARAEQAARARYAAGEGAYADVLRAQVELARLEDRLVSLRDRRRPLAAALNAALGRDPDAPLPAPDALSEPQPLPGEDRLQALLRERNPALAAVRARESSLASAEGLARKGGWPDLTLGLDYIETGTNGSGMPGEGSDPVIARLSLSLPLWRGSVAAARREAAARHRAQVSAVTDLGRDLASRLADALFRRRDAERRLALHDRTLLPRSREILTVLEASYAAGGAGYLDLVDAQRTLLAFELERARAAADLAALDAELQELLGGRIPAAESIAGEEETP